VERIFDARLPIDDALPAEEARAAAQNLLLRFLSKRNYSTRSSDSDIIAGAIVLKRLLKKATGDVDAERGEIDSVVKRGKAQMKNLMPKAGMLVVLGSFG
jgi:hypothetical protein